jgi:threonine synthase
MKTIAFEIAEQLPGQIDPQAPARWQAPDWYFQAVSGGIGPIGVMKGFHELADMGLIDSIPSMGIIQSAGCAPMVHAWKAGKSVAEAVLQPSTHITSLTTGDPGRAYTHLRQQMLAASGGVMESVTDEETFQALHLVAKLEGLSMEPAASAAFAGLIKLAQAGILNRDDVIVINCSGHAIAVEGQLLAPGWAQTIDSREYALPDHPKEGLLAALNSLDASVVKQVLIVDDQADARRLIRRVLEAQGAYTVREAANGSSALDQFEAHRPDLVILDLMMPDMDGFAVLEALKSKSELVDVPVIVVTAKELSSEELSKLQGRIEGLLIKGDFLGDDLIDHVDTILD